jgi:hypothetical protein
MGGCLDLREQTIVFENATLTSSASHLLQIGLSSSPLLCGFEGSGDFENYFDISIDRESPLGEGTIIPLDSLRAALTSFDGDKYLNASAYVEDPAAPDFEASVEIFTLPTDPILQTRLCVSISLFIRCFKALQEVNGSEDYPIEAPSRALG